MEGNLKHARNTSYAALMVSADSLLIPIEVERDAVALEAMLDTPEVGANAEMQLQMKRALHRIREGGLHINETYEVARASFERGREVEELIRRNLKQARKSLRRFDKIVRRGGSKAELNLARKQLADASRQS